MTSNYPPGVTGSEPQILGISPATVAADFQLDRCFACGRKLKSKPRLVDTHDDQLVYVGSDCYKKIKAAGATGYKPPRGGPRLYDMP